MGKPTRNSERRGQILEAALGCFLERGYHGTSLADIRAASGASTGSVYHFFKGKGAIATALIEAAVSGWGAEARAGAASGSGAEQAIRASVQGLLAWGVANPRLARFMDEVRLLAPADPDFAPLRALFGRGRDNAEALYGQWTAAGAVRALPWPLAHALMLGPTYDFIRFHAAETQKPEVIAAASMLADAAWEAVRARPREAHG